MHYLKNYLLLCFFLPSMNQRLLPHLPTNAESKRRKKKLVKVIGQSQHLEFVNRINFFKCILPSICFKLYISFSYLYCIHAIMI